jgi:tRNA G10  N-methylase Trm11
MSKFVVLGNNPALSLAELSAVLGHDIIMNSRVSSQIAVVERDFDAAGVMRKLGGTIKIGRILSELSACSVESLTNFMVDFLKESRSGLIGRATFGYSSYALHPSARLPVKALDRLGMAVKKHLVDDGLPIRWVKAQEGTALSSVVVSKNRLVEEGAEFIVLADKDRCLLGVTEAVQPFEEFSAADYGRPGRDTVQGMLPPKVARMMVNLTGSPCGKLLDPFCGSGTVLTEALQTGWKDVVGSDKNPAAIEDTAKNIAWFRERKLIPPDAKSDCFVSDSRNIAGKIAAMSVAAVITEPYLGPPRRGREKRGELQRTLDGLSGLYAESLSAWRRLLKPGAVVVMALPVYVLGEERHTVSLDFTKLGYEKEPLLPAQVISKLAIKPGKHGGIVYGRPGQLVLREIVKLTLKP